MILKLSYTACKSGEILKKTAKKAMNDAFKKAEKSSLARLFSTKHEFPTEWHQFLHSTLPTVALNLDLSPECFSFLFRGKKLEIQKVEFFLRLKEGKKPGSDNTYTELYVAGSLTISLKSSNGTANGKLLKSTPSFLNGTPHVIIEDEDTAVPIEVKSGNEAAWSLTVETARLNQLKDALVDLFIICHYTVSDVTGSIFRYAISSVLAKNKLEKLRVRALSNNKEYVP